MSCWTPNWSFCTSGCLESVNKSNFSDLPIINNKNLQDNEITTTFHCKIKSKQWKKTISNVFETSSELAVIRFLESVAEVTDFILMD